jgi:mono/diheme cytochrome c family protein
MANDAMKSKTPPRSLFHFTAIGICFLALVGCNPGGGNQNFSFNPIDGKLDESQVQELNLQVRTIFAHKCYSCHGRAKSKGELRLDTKEFVFAGGENGDVIVPGDPEKSELIRRINLSRFDEDKMPEKGERLTDSEIETLELWVKVGAPWPDGKEKSVYRVAALEPRLPVIPAEGDELKLPLDRFVNAYFRKNKIKWAVNVDDKTYIRRVYLDVIGLVPPPDSIDAFVKDGRGDKYDRLVQKLLNRDADYAQHWLTFWNDALRNDYTGTGYITGGRFDITKWLYASLKENKPYDVFVRELINPSKESSGFIAGIKWRGTINSSQRVEMQAAQNVSQVFLGLNLKCASCHDSFINDWTLDDAYAFANIFADTVLEINKCDKPTGKFAGRRMLYPELGKIDSSAFTKERLKQLADYLTQPNDGRLYRTLVNRVWAQLMGRGIVEPVDAMDNEPWSQDLLDWLASDFVANGRDMKKLIHTILTSKTYRLPSVSAKEPEHIMAADFVFKGMIRRRLTAEQFADAISATLRPIYPDSAMAQKLLPATIKNEIPFPRAALVINDPFLIALGRPTRETVSTSRASQANLLQALELTNGALFNSAVQRSAMALAEKYSDVEIMITEVYRRMLGRVPNADENLVAQKALGTPPTKEAIQDFIWAMALHPEFQLVY